MYKNKILVTCFGELTLFFFFFLIGIDNFKHSWRYIPSIMKILITELQKSKQYCESLHFVLFGLLVASFGGSISLRLDVASIH